MWEVTLMFFTTFGPNASDKYESLPKPATRIRLEVLYPFNFRIFFKYSESTFSL